MHTAPVERYHSLDALRAAMMLLGLVLHSAASYTFAPIPDAWPFHDPPGRVAFEILLVFIHLFRMPAFFLVAGFFGALLYYREGARGFLRNRGRRIGLPLVMFWATALPLAAVGFAVAARREGVPIPAELRPRGPLLSLPILGHLWFLYDLLLFYVAAVLLVPLARRMPAAIRARTRALVDAIAVRWLGAVALGIMTTLTLLPMQGPGLETSAALLPPARILVAYGVFFVFGWGLYAKHETLVPAFKDRWGRCLVSGLLVWAGYLAVLIAKPRMDPRTWHLAAIAFAGPAIWLMIFGMLGGFVRYLQTPRPLVRYLSDASYWMYLTHLTVITWTVALLAPTRLGAIGKFLIVLGVTTAVTLVTYHYLVRSTRVGVLLNGRRYPRG